MQFANVKIPTNFYTKLGSAATHLLDRDFLYTEYVLKNRSTRQIARDIKCGKKAVSTALKRFVIPLGNTSNKMDVQAVRAQKCRSRLGGVADILMDRNKLSDLYIAQNLSSVHIAEQLGVSNFCVRKWLRFHHIRKSREQSIECMKIEYERKNGHKIGSLEFQRKRWASGKRIQSKKGGTIFCHSSWEEKLAKRLDDDDEILTFKKEPFPIPYFFDGKNRNYYPDFFVLRSDGVQLVVEIKPQAFLKIPMNMVKFEAAKKFCEDRNMKFVLMGCGPISSDIRQGNIQYELAKIKVLI